MARKIHFMAAASLVALMAASPAITQAADSNTKASMETSAKVKANNPDTPEVETVTEQDIREGVENTKQAVKETYEDVKAALFDGNTAARDVSYDKRSTAEKIIGQEVLNDKRQKIATVEDIIVDTDGTARLVVVKDGGLLGFGGKLAAFDYGTVIKNDGKTEMVTPLTEADMESAATFSYDAEDADDKTRLMPASGISIARLLDGNLQGADGQKVADIEDVTFKAGKADMVITSAGEVLEMGGKKIALGFDTADIARDKEDINLKLDAQKTARFQQLEQSKSTTE